MMKKTIFLLLFLISSANASSLPLIGLDSKGTPKEILISKKKWGSKLKESISILSESTLESLDQSKFSFYKVSVGTYIKMKLGLGSLITGTAEPYFKLYFSKK